MRRLRLGLCRGLLVAMYGLAWLGCRPGCPAWLGGGVLFPLMRRLGSLGSRLLPPGEEF